MLTFSCESWDCDSDMTVTCICVRVSQSDPPVFDLCKSVPPLTAAASATLQGTPDSPPQGVERCLEQQEAMFGEGRVS